MGKKFDSGYNISVVAKHFQMTDAIRNYVIEKVGKVDHLADHILDITVALDTQKLEHTCSILMNFLHFHIKAESSTDNIYSAIDKAADRLSKLIRKYKSKLQSHRAKHLSTVDIHVNVIEPLKDDLAKINDEIEAETARREEQTFELHRIVAKEKTPLKMLTTGEAVMKMELSGDFLLIFKGEEDQKMKVLYRRPDANYALVQVE